MTHEAELAPDRVVEPLRMLWTGRSGRRYVLTSVEPDGLSLQSGHLYALATGGIIRWVGSSDDLIADHVSRARFRAALTDGASVMHMATPADEIARLTLVWDLEGTSATRNLSAA